MEMSDDFNPEQEMPDDLQAIYDMARRKEREVISNFLIRESQKPHSFRYWEDALIWVAEQLSENKHLV